MHVQYSTQKQFLPSVLATDLNRKVTNAPESGRRGMLSCATLEGQ